MLKNYKELKEGKHSGNRKDVESADNFFRKQTLESLTP
jgi:hypothetical protein